MAVTVASWIGLTVSAQRDVSPNRSCSRSASAAEYRRRCGSMRIWQRSAMACTRTPDRSVMASWNDRVGVTANRSAVAPVQPKIRSAMSVLPFSGDRPLAQALQERGQRGAGLRPAVEPLPEQPELADQRVALVDRDQENLVTLVRGGLGGASPRTRAALRPVHEDGLDVGCHLPEQRVRGREPVPGRQV